MALPAMPNQNLPQTALYDDAGHQVVAARAKNVATDSTTTAVYGDMEVQIANANANGQNTMANSAPVSIASNQTPLVTSTGAKSSVGSSASSVTLLASNANRKKMMVYNDSTQVLYLDLTGGTASNSSYSVQIAPGGSWLEAEQPIYTGLITGIWAAANGNARVTEWT